MTGYGKICSDISWNMIETVGECITAVENLGLSYHGTAHSDYQSGCYAYQEQYAYFNTKEHDKGHPAGNAICKQGVY